MNDAQLIASRLRIRHKAPFYGALLMYARLRWTREIPTAATDGVDLYFNPEFVETLDRAQLDGLMLHEVLHAALRHVPRRRKEFDPGLWNVACDIVVNGMIAGLDWVRLPHGGIRNAKVEQLSLEEVYALLMREAHDGGECSHPDLHNPGELQGDEVGGALGSGSRPQKGKNQEAGSDGSDQEGEKDQVSGKGKSQRGADEDGSDGADQEEGRAAQEAGSRRETGSDGPQGDKQPSNQPSEPVKTPISTLQEIEAHWKQAMLRAAAVAQFGGKARGDMPAGLRRALGEIEKAQLDWRSMLWRFATPSAVDFVGFDRRFIGRGLYLEDMAGETIRVAVCIDTSGSVSSDDLKKLMGEVYGILQAYPDIEATLYFADARLYGPHPIRLGDPYPTPQGGGGTAFEPFFAAMNQVQSETAHQPLVTVYLTDGYGSFPREVPSFPVLWVVTPGGLEEEKFPFGEVAALWH